MNDWLTLMFFDVPTRRQMADVSVCGWNWGNYNLTASALQFKVDDKVRRSFSSCVRLAAPLGLVLRLSGTSERACMRAKSYGCSSACSSVHVSAAHPAH